jgi:uncharacterized protein YeaO (DUF488 family)
MPKMDLEKREKCLSLTISRTQSRSELLEAMFHDQVAIFRGFKSRLDDAISTGDSERAMELFEGMTEAEPVKKACMLNEQLTKNAMAMHKIIFGNGIPPRARQFPAMPTAEIVDAG